MDLTNRQQLIQYLKSHGLYTKKKLGQNFLVDRGALNKIVEAAELSSDDCVIEVGPGLGVLTGELVEKAGKVVAVELDQKLAEFLEENLYKVHNPQPSLLPKGEGTPSPGVTGESGLSSVALAKDGGEGSDDNIVVINQDILRTNINELTKACPSYKVVANIPYYITSKILRFFLEAEKKPESIVLLTQKEVAERIVAKPGDMSILSVSVQYYGQPEIIGIVPKTSFFPVPEVDSAILRITVYDQPTNGQRTNRQQTTDKESTVRGPSSLSSIPDKDFFRCVHIGFASRRKTLLNNLSAGYHLDKKSMLDILVSVRLTDKTRAQELSIDDWQRLCQAIGNNLDC